MKSVAIAVDVALLTVNQRALMRKIIRLIIIVVFDCMNCLDKCAKGN